MGFYLALLLLGLPACEGSRETAPGPQVGTKAPGFAARDLKGQTWNLDQVKGKVVLLRFWTDQCPYCLFEMPVIEKYYRRLKPAGFEVLAVNIKQSPQVAEAFIAQMDITFPVLLDLSGKMAERYKVYAVPTNFLIDRALGERVHELGDVTARLPHLPGQDYRGVNAPCSSRSVTIERHHSRLMLFFSSTPSGSNTQLNQ